MKSELLLSEKGSIEKGLHKVIVWMMLEPQFQWCFLLHNYWRVENGIAIVVEWSNLIHVDDKWSEEYDYQVRLWTVCCGRLECCFEVKPVRNVYIAHGLLTAPSQRRSKLQSIWPPAEQTTALLSFDKISPWMDSLNETISLDRKNKLLAGISYVSFGWTVFIHPLYTWLKYFPDNGDIWM